MSSEAESLTTKICIFFASVVPLDSWDWGGGATGMTEITTEERLTANRIRIRRFCRVTTKNNKKKY